MSIEIARAMLATPRTRSSFDHINNNYSAFVWDDHGDEVERWNALAGAAAGGADVTVEENEGKLPRFHYKGQVIEVPVLEERGDNTICVVTLAQLVKTDSDLRACVDTFGNSECAFLPLPPAAWKLLEAEFGLEAVAYRFLELPPNVDDFYDAAGADEVFGRKYPDDPKPEPDPRRLRLEALQQQVQAVLAPTHPGLRLDFYMLLLVDSVFGLRATVATDAQRDRLRSDSAGLLKIKPLIDAAARDTGLRLRGIHFDSEGTPRRPTAPFSGIIDIGEIPAVWTNPPPAAAPRPAPAPLSPAAASPGTIGVSCPYCGTAFKAVPGISILGFRSFACPACGKSFQRGLGLKMRLVCWGLLGLIVWFWAQQPSDMLLLALLYFAGMVLTDLFQLSRHSAKPRSR